MNKNETSFEEGQTYTVEYYLSRPLYVCKVHESETLVNGKSVAIVGNSGNLLRQTHGSHIDSHDVVIRFNWAPTEGYEGHVGSKTTIRISNTHFMKAAADEEFCKKMKSDYSNWDENFYFNLENQTIIVKKMSPNVNEPEVDDEIIARIREKGNTVDAFDDRFPIYVDNMFPNSSASMGFLALALCMANKCDGLGAKSISCFGFNFYEDLPDERHYFDKMTQPLEKQRASHSFDCEKDILNELQRDGILKIYNWQQRIVL